jgi:hypothetical protein
VNSQDFVNYVNEKTGTDYTWFFNQYLHNRFTPVLEYYMEGNKFYYRWTHANPDFKMSIGIRPNGDDEATMLTPTTSVQSFEYSTAIRGMYLPEELQLFGVKENAKLKKLAPGR